MDTEMNQMHGYTLDVGIALYSNYAMQCNAMQHAMVSNAI